MTSSSAPTPRDSSRPAEAQFFVNGVARPWQAGIGLAELLAELDAAGFGVAVELDGTVVRRAEYDSIEVPQSARVEIVRLVGGG